MANSIFLGPFGFVNDGSRIVFPVGFPGVIEVDAIAAVSTDGFTLQNATLAAAGVPVQRSPRFRFRANVWNTTGAGSNNTDDWWIEDVPVSDTTPIGQLQFFHSANGAAGVRIADLNDLGHFGVAGGGRFYFIGSTLLSDLSNGVITIRTNTGTSGFGLDGSADNICKIRTRTNAAAYATVDALAYQVSGTPGVSASVTTGELVGKTLTFVNGICTGFA